MLKNTLIYTSSSIISSAIPFLLLPVLTRLLSPEEYGQVAMFTIFTTALAAFVGLSVHGAAGRRYFDDDVTSRLLARFNANCLLILFVSTIFSVLTLSLLDDLVALYLGVSVYWIYLGILSVFCGFLLNIRLGLWQVRGKAKHYGITQIANALIGFSLSILLVVCLALGAEGRIYGIVIASVLIGTISILSLKKDKLILFEYSKEDIQEALAFGVPLIPHVLGGFLLLSVDRLVINQELGLEMTGIYMVAVSFGSAFNIVFNSINNAYVPWLFGQLKEGGAERKYRIVKYTYFYFLFLLVMSFLAFYVAPPILRLVVGESFYTAAESFPIIILGQVFFGMYLMVTNYIFYVKKTKCLSIVTIVSGLINLGLLLIFIPYFGIIGAALAFMLANFIRFIVTWFVASRVCSMPWNLLQKKLSSS